MEGTIQIEVLPNGNIEFTQPDGKSSQIFTPEGLRRLLLIAKEKEIWDIIDK